MENKLFVTALALVMTSAVAYVTHLLWMFNVVMTAVSVTGGQVFLMIAGLLFPPIGVMHGVYLWFM